MSIWTRLRGAFDRLTEALRAVKEMIMAEIDDLTASVQKAGQAVSDVVTYVGSQRGKIAELEKTVAELQQLVDSGSASVEELADLKRRMGALTASIDADTDAIAQAVAPVVQDGNTDTGDVDAPAPQNPDTQDPGSVDGSVDAGDPAPGA